MPNYLCYHLHTEDSLLDSCTNHKLYADKAVEYGMSAICYTEHGNIFNWIEKKMYANSKGLKFLLGCEVYLTKTLDPENLIRDNYHTILIAKNEDGRNELRTLIDLSTQEDHHYYKPRLSFEEFLNISDNIIKISACLLSPLNKLEINSIEDEEMYMKLLKHYDFLEVQPHINSDEQKEYNKKLWEFSKTFNIPLIAGTDTHSIDDYKAECRAILKKAKNMAYDNEDSFDLTFHSYDKLVDMFKKQGVLPIDVILEAIENTNKVADMCDDTDLDTSFKYPIISDDENKTLRERIKRMYQEKVDKGIIKDDPRYLEMAETELKVFEKIGMIGFMLFMSKLTCWCWDNNIPVGFCRGSVGGSMVAYLTDIIDVNPLRWETVFSRFANESRKEIGDIDIDISPDQRELVYKHIIEEYGQDKTAYVLAMTTVADLGTIDEIGRALNYPLNKVAKIKEEFKQDEEKTRKKYKDLFYYFDGIVGTTVAQSVHPAGIIVSPISLYDNYGTFWSRDNKRIICINMEEIHEVSLVKYDLLGLKNIQIIRECCELAGISYPKSYEINWEDEEVWKHITDSPVGIFQFEGAYAFDCLKRFGCRKVNDLSLVNAALRPSGASYRDRLLDHKINKNPSELIDKLLEDNNGYLVFQEDTIKFLTDICGLDGSEADNIRRAIGRKQKDRLEAALPQILEGYCSKSDKPRGEAEKEAQIFLQIIEDSSDYQFGYNHSTGYSMIGYMCGYLRYYYPKEFLTAYLNNAQNDDDIIMGNQLANQLGIFVKPIKFRYSSAKYTSTKDSIYKGIASVKHLNEEVSQQLYDLRDNHYDTFVDLLMDIKDKTSCDSRQLDILTKLDFFSEFGRIGKLLKIEKAFASIYGKKQMKKDKAEELGLTEYVKKYSGKETEKMYSMIDSIALLKDIESSTFNRVDKVGDIIVWQDEFLGYMDYVNPNIPKTYMVVTHLNTKYSPRFDGYCLNNGKTVTFKARKTEKPSMMFDTFVKKPFEDGDIISIVKCSKRNKSKMVDGEWVKIPDEYEWWLDKYEIVNLEV